MLRFLLLLIFISGISVAQVSVDSLIQVSNNTALNSKARARALISLTDIVSVDEIEIYSKKAMQLLTEADSLKYPYTDFIRDKIHLQINLSYFYKQKNAFKKAQSLEFQTLRLAEKINDESLIAQCRYNIGMSYYSQNDFTKSLNFLLKAFPVFQKDNDDEYLIPSLISIGVIYQDLKKYTQSIYFYSKAIQKSMYAKEYNYLALAYTNLAVNYTYLKQYDSATVNSNRGLNQMLLLNDNSSLAWAYNVKANILYEKKHTDSAVYYSLKSLSVSEKLNQLTEQKISAKQLFYHYRNKKDFEKALGYYLQFDQLSDSIINDENRLALTRNEIEYDYAKKEESLLLESEKKALQFSEERKRNYVIIFSVLAILAVSLFFGYMVFKSLKLEKLAKKTVLEQKGIIEEKQKEIIDSINYAKSLQEAILPPMSLWQKQLPHSFVLYKPKDIVAGDFYWMEKSNGLLFFAVADCTGHGVPGAMVSVVCSNALNRSVLEFKLKDPAEILAKTRELVISTFEKSEKQVRDGMDISLCVFDKDNLLLHWAGANNPLWYIHNQQLYRLAADKQPVGEYIEDLPFTTHTIQVQTDTFIYLFSDGYADQFGGPKGKKFKYKQLEELLISISHESMPTQKQKLEVVFENWKGDLEQVDDVCVIGIKI